MVARGATDVRVGDLVAGEDHQDPTLLVGNAAHARLHVAAAEGADPSRHRPRSQGGHPAAPGADLAIAGQPGVAEHTAAGTVLSLEAPRPLRRAAADEDQSSVEAVELGPTGAELSSLLFAENAAEVAQPDDDRGLPSPLVAETDQFPVEIPDADLGEGLDIHVNKGTESAPRGDQGDLAMAPATVVLGEALEVLRRLPDACAGLIYVDPPFNTGEHRLQVRMRGRGDPEGARIGFAGRRYRQIVERSPGYDDDFDDYLAWLRPRLVETRRLLAPHGSLYFHIDPRESHYCKLLLDEIFGRRCFLNEVVWAYDYGGRPRRRWAPKHDIILVYVRHPDTYHFDLGAVDRVPYLAPRLQTPERAALGKVPTDVWWQTIVPTNSRERTGYPTQKPLPLLRRIVAVSSRPGDLVLDWCAGSGTTGVAAHQLGRRFLLVDSSTEAVAVMRGRLAGVTGLTVQQADRGQITP